MATFIAARLVRHLIRRRRGLIRIVYTDGRSVALPRGSSVLEESWLLGVPHASVCGALGRCSTCRVQAAAADADALPPPGAEESRVLRRVGAEPDVRLACQLRPRGPVSVAPLLDAALPPRGLLRFRTPRMLGAEREVLIVFADLRDLTRITEHCLPFDVVHLPNRYFRAMGGAAEVADGRVDKFIGDGVDDVGEPHDLAVRGRAEPLRVRAAELPALARERVGAR